MLVESIYLALLDVPTKVGGKRWREDRTSTFDFTSVAPLTTALSSPASENEFKPTLPFIFSEIGAANKTLLKKASPKNSVTVIEIPRNTPTPGSL